MKVRLESSGEVRNRAGASRKRSRSIGNRPAAQKRRLFRKIEQRQPIPIQAFDAFPDRIGTDRFLTGGTEHVEIVRTRFLRFRLAGRKKLQLPDAERAAAATPFVQRKNTNELPAPPCGHDLETVCPVSRSIDPPPRSKPCEREGRSSVGIRCGESLPRRANGIPFVLPAADGSGEVIDGGIAAESGLWISSVSIGTLHRR